MNEDLADLFVVNSMYDLRYGEGKAKWESIQHTMSLSHPGITFTQKMLNKHMQDLIRDYLKNASAYRSGGGEGKLSEKLACCVAYSCFSVSPHAGEFDDDDLTRLGKNLDVIYNKSLEAKDAADKRRLANVAKEATNLRRGELLAPSLGLRQGASTDNTQAPASTSPLGGGGGGASGLAPSVRRSPDDGDESDEIPSNKRRRRGESVDRAVEKAFQERAAEQARKEKRRLELEERREDTRKEHIASQERIEMARIASQEKVAAMHAEVAVKNADSHKEMMQLMRFIMDKKL